MAGLLSIGVTSLNAAQINLLTAQHNIANANTPGYSRQVVSQAANSPIMTGSGSMGQGVHVQTVYRSYDAVLSGQVNQAQNKVSELDAYYGEIKQIENMLADPTSGLTPALQEFFKGVQEVAANPTLMAARQSMVSTASSLATRFHTMDTRLTELYSGVNTQIRSNVNLINTYANSIATLNEKIVQLKASNQPPNDLLDQRNELVADLNKLVRTSSVEDSYGNLNVFIGSGQQLVVGRSAQPLVAVPSIVDQERLVVGQQIGNGWQEFSEGILNGGALGGLLAFRDESLDKVANSLGQVAASLALTFNAQHSLGQDKLGNVTGSPQFIDNFFTISDPKVVANSRNTGGATLSATFVTPPPVDTNGNFYTNVGTSDYQIEQIGNSGTNDFRLTRLSDNTTWFGNTMADISNTLTTEAGVNVSLAGATNVGDSFLLEPTRDIAHNIGVNTAIAADVNKIAAASPMRTSAASANTGNGRITAGAVSTGYTVPGAPITLTFDSTTNTFNSGAPALSLAYSGPATSFTVNGFSFQISGAPANGDQFTLEANTSGVADGRNMIKLGQLQTQNTTNGGTATYQVAYATLVSDVGIKTREVKVAGEAQATMLEQAVQARDAVSGVNLDEEAANLIRYQQAYQASARMMEIGSKLFDEILSISR